MTSSANFYLCLALGQKVDVLSFECLNVDQIEAFKEAICKQKDGNSKGMRLRSDDGKAYCGGKVLSVSRVIIHDICNALDNFCPSKPKWVIGHNSGDGKVFHKLFRRHIKV